MIDDYVLHFPLTDFPVAFLVLAALVECGRLAFRRPWTLVVDVLLLFGWLGALVAVGSGLWLVAIMQVDHADELAVHHYFAYATLGAATIAGVARLLVTRRPKLAVLKTLGILASALLVSGAGFVGGAMAHSSEHDMPGAPSQASGSEGAPPATVPQPAHGH